MQLNNLFNKVSFCGESVDLFCMEPNDNVMSLKLFLNMFIEICVCCCCIKAIICCCIKPNSCCCCRCCCCYICYWIYCSDSFICMLNYCWVCCITCKISTCRIFCASIYSPFSACLTPFLLSPILSSLVAIPSFH